jgi:hypothetical protein
MAIMAIRPLAVPIQLTIGSLKMKGYVFSINFPFLLDSSAMMIT